MNAARERSGTWIQCRFSGSCFRHQPKCAKADPQAAAALRDVGDTRGEAWGHSGPQTAASLPPCVQAFALLQEVGSAYLDKNEASTRTSAMLQGTSAVGKLMHPGLVDSDLGHVLQSIPYFTDASRVLTWRWTRR